MSRNRFWQAEKNNDMGSGSLTDSEITMFVDAVNYLRRVVSAAYGQEWSDGVFAGDGYCITARQVYARVPAYYTGIRKMSIGYALIGGDDTNYEGELAAFSRFEDAVKGYAAKVIDQFRVGRSGNNGYVSWLWNGSPGPGVSVGRATARNGEFRFFLADDPEVWIEGSKSDATLSHGLQMSLPAFVSVIIAHPPVTGGDTTAWPELEALQAEWWSRGLPG